MDKNALLFYQSACELKLPSTKIEEIVGFKVTLGKKLFFFRGGETPFNYGSSISVTSDKFCMNKILEKSNFPVPKADVFHKNIFYSEETESLINHLKFPLVIKPTIGTALGQDVLCNIGTIDQVKAYMKKCYLKYDYLSVEEFHPNLSSYRVLVYFNKVIGVVQRFPASVVGDGVHTIEELIRLENLEREKLQNRVTLGPIKADEECFIRLKELNMTLDTIPKDKEKVVLCYACNSSRGGTMKSLGTTLCKENSKMLRQAARALSLNMVGFDVCCEDINIPMSQSRGVIIEANHNPDISIHENPIFGMRNRVSKKILRRLIFKHPLAYILSLYRDKQSRLYINFAILIALIVVFQ
jgi:D-alanine-D-alanine ligase-like ATP-grasp enzyme